MRDPLSPKQVATAIGVSESSLKRWCDRGLIPTVRTAGGHRRLPIAGVLQFLRNSNHQLVQPELLGLPTATGSGIRGAAQAYDEFMAALLAGDGTRCRRIVFDLYLAEHSIAMIFDDVIATSFRDIGDGWDCGNIEVYQERHACQIVSSILFELQLLLPTPPADAPLAIGATPEGDHYSLATQMVSMTLRDCGWDATSLGCMLPFSTLRAAVRKSCPRLFWLSVSTLSNEEEFLAQYTDFYEEFAGQLSIVVGGRGLTESIRHRMQYSAYCDNLRHLTAFIASLDSAHGYRPTLIENGD